MSKICVGCGLKLQNQSEDKPGYTDNLENTYCKRCFRLKNYGELKSKSVINNADILKKVNQKEGIVFFLIDYLNINNETINYFKKIKIPKVLIISKSDTLRKEMKKENIRNWLLRVYDIKEDILFISANKSYPSANIFEYLNNTGYNTAYIMGITNAGKSTFINNILKRANIKREILVSKNENTTLDFIKLKVGVFTIYDTPGFTYSNLGNSLINKEIKPISFQVRGNTTIVIEKKYKCFFPEPNKVILYLTTEDIGREYKKGDDLKNTVKITRNQDLLLPGLGFLNIKEPCQVNTNFLEYEVRMDLSEF